MAINNKSAAAGDLKTAEHWRKKGAKAWAKAMDAVRRDDEDAKKINFKMAHNAYRRFHECMDAMFKHAEEAEEDDKMRDAFLAEEEDVDEKELERMLDADERELEKMLKDI